MDILLPYACYYPLMLPQELTRMEYTIMKMSTMTMTRWMISTSPSQDKVRRRSLWNMDFPLRRKMIWMSPVMNGWSWWRMGGRKLPRIIWGRDNHDNNLHNISYQSKVFAHSLEGGFLQQNPQRLFKNRVYKNYLPYRRCIICKNKESTYFFKLRKHKI